MARMAIVEALSSSEGQSPGTPMLLCVAEQDRPGRTAELDERLFREIEDATELHFGEDSAVIPYGRVGVAMALAEARTLLRARRVARCLVVAVDSFLNAATLSYLERADRLLTPANPNGIIPGEGAAAILVGVPAHSNGLVCDGIGFGREPGPLGSDRPTRADGMTQAIKLAIADAGHSMDEVDFRISDLSGEQYFFKEAALALTRTVHAPKGEIDLWHPAECTGEVGSVAGGSVLVLAESAFRKNFGKGDRILAHFAGDDDRRAALSLRYVEG
jgi:3-oxoacyl-[acyl-carrier-protein] synthase I